MYTCVNTHFSMAVPKGIMTQIYNGHCYIWLKYTVLWVDTTWHWKYIFLQSAPYQSIINNGIITVTLRPLEHYTDMMIPNTSLSSKQPHHILTWLKCLQRSMGGLVLCVYEEISYDKRVGLKHAAAVIMVIRSWFYNISIILLWLTEDIKI